MSLIWATRGRTWGFRFLLDGGYDDPLPEYDRVFSSIDADPPFIGRVGSSLALRLLDPEERKDAAGRVIPHDFVVSGPLADRIESIEDAIRLVWETPEVRDEFARIWAEPDPPRTR